MLRSAKLLFLSILIFSCNQEIIDSELNLPPSDPETNSTPTNVPLLRADSDLADDWDWTTDEVLDMYRKRASDGKSIKIYGAKTPFYSIHELSEDQDMYPEDGWMLVFKNFGSIDIAPVGDLPSFAIYNKYSGILRVMTYVPQELTSNYTYMLSTLEPSQSSDLSPLFTFYSKPTESPIINHDPESNIFHTSEGYDYQHYWAHSDFILAGYDPDINTKDIVFDLKISGVSVTKGDGSITGSVEQILSQRNVAGKWDTIDDLKNGVDTGVSYFKSANNILDIINSLQGNAANRQKNDDHVTHRTKVEPTTIIAGITAAIGVVKGYIDSKKESKSQMPIKFDANLDVKLKLETISSLYNLKISLSPNSLHASAIKPVQDIKWGVFNLKNIPKYTLNKYKYFKQNYDSPYKVTREQVVDVATTQFLSNIVHNPELQNVTYQVGFVKQKNGEPKYFSGFTSSISHSKTEYFDGTPVYYLPANVIELAIKVTHKYTHPQEGVKKVDIVKTYPLNIGIYNFIKITDPIGPGPEDPGPR